MKLINLSDLDGMLPDTISSRLAEDRDVIILRYYQKHYPEGELYITQDISPMTLMRYGYIDMIHYYVGSITYRALNHMYQYHGNGD